MTHLWILNDTLNDTNRNNSYNRHNFYAPTNTALVNPMRKKNPESNIKKVGRYAIVVRVPSCCRCPWQMMGQCPSSGQGDPSPFFLGVQNTKEPLAVTEYGVLQGKQIHVKIPINVFLGVPFSRPLVGTCSFAFPEPLEPWEGVRDATTCARQYSNLSP